jgi:acetylornithine deacetylase/succinyl-diaminopimelate desuccinylase-like protein
VRCGDGPTKAAAVRAIADRMDAIAAARGVTITRTVISDDHPVPLDGDLVDGLEDACRARGIPYQAMPSGAGHDAMEIATMAPAGMLFVPSEGGISHSPAEWTDPEQIAVGVDVMTDVVRGLRR